jgi:hypothetical protein
MKTHRGDSLTKYQDNWWKNIIKNGYFVGKTNNSQYNPDIHVEKRRQDGKILPDWQNYKNGDILEGIEYRPYEEQKAYWIARITNHPFYGRLPVNREYCAKTNTRESRYKGLRRMLKEGILIQRRGYVEIVPVKDRK